MVIDCVAMRTSELAPIARTVAPAATVIVVPAMMHSDGPPVCAWISLQLPAPTLAVLIVVVSETGVVGARCRHTLPRSLLPKQLPASVVGGESTPASPPRMPPVVQ